MRADTPVPEGFLYFDFVPHNDDKAGLPYISQFAYATFSGDMDAMHTREDYDSDAMYDVTRNIMLDQGVNIPYPNKYWTAKVHKNVFQLARRLDIIASIVVWGQNIVCFPLMI